MRTQKPYKPTGTLGQTADVRRRIQVHVPAGDLTCCLPKQKILFQHVRKLLQKYGKFGTLQVAEVPY